jgi:hypothetical protein
MAQARVGPWAGTWPPPQFCSLCSWHIACVVSLGWWDASGWPTVRNSEGRPAESCRLPLLSCHRLTRSRLGRRRLSTARHHTPSCRRELYGLCPNSRGRSGRFGGAGLPSRGTEASPGVAQGRQIFAPGRSSHRGARRCSTKLQSTRQAARRGRDRRRPARCVLAAGTSRRVTCWRYTGHQQHG